jgi:hypothetical protein
MMQAGQILREERRCFHETRRDPSYGIRNALAKKVRREYPGKPIDSLRAEYGLSEGEARNVVYGNASLRSIEKIMKAGGLGLAIELWADALSDSLEDYLKREAEEAAHAETRAASIRRAAEARLRLVEGRSLGPDPQE